MNADVTPFQATASRLHCLLLFLLLVPVMTAAQLGTLRRSSVSRSPTLPHCTEIDATTAEISRRNLDTALTELLVETAVNTRLNLEQTACVLVSVKDELDNASHTGGGLAERGRSLLYTFKYVAYEQQYPVKMRYEFAIPKVDSSCQCDCPGGDVVCNPRYKYQNCSRGNLCVTTHHAHQSAKGCPQSDAASESELCCEVYFRPMGGRRFHALYLGQPSAYIRIHVSAYLLKDDHAKKLLASSRTPAPLSSTTSTATPTTSHNSSTVDSKTRNLTRVQKRTAAESTPETKEAPKESIAEAESAVEVIREDEFVLEVHGQQQQNIRAGTSSLEKEGFRLSVHTSDSANQYSLATEAMHYFAPIYASEQGNEPVPLFSGIPLNEFQEWDVGKLGWFRTLPGGKFFIKNANLKFRIAHHAQVDDCKEQTYLDQYDAEFYNIDPDRLLDQFAKNVDTTMHPWIHNVVYLPGSDTADQDRQVTIECAMAASIELNVNLRDRPQISFGFHESSMADFDGIIRLDKFSNRYLNITFTKAKGTLIGAVYRGANKFVLDTVLSTYLPSSEPQWQVLHLPATVNGTRWVCFYPSTKPELEKCHQLLYNSEPLSWFTIPQPQWSANKGDCVGCNEFSSKDFVKYLNPLEWFKGVGSWSEALAVGVEVVFYAVIIIIAIAFCRKCICPLLKWSCTDSQNCFEARQRRFSNSQTSSSRTNSLENCTSKRVVQGVT